MRQVAINIYKYDELSEMAQSRAYNDFQKTDDYYNGIDNRKTLEAFESIFPIKVSNWEYGYQYFINFNFLDDSIRDMKGVRLATYINNNYYDELYKGKYYSTMKYADDGRFVYKSRRSRTMLDNECTLTGYYMDDVILTPVYEFLLNPHDGVNFKQLMRQCLNAWVKSCDEDYHAYYSVEHFKEMCEANEWEFYADGKMFR